eukprot:8162443-Pyramimonas_sp.AAC.1
MLRLLRVVLEPPPMMMMPKRPMAVDLHLDLALQWRPQDSKMKETFFLDAVANNAAPHTQLLERYSRRASKATPASSSIEPPMCRRLPHARLPSHRSRRSVKTNASQLATKCVGFSTGRQARGHRSPARH